jgi:hypothetical protein
MSDMSKLQEKQCWKGNGQQESLLCTRVFQAHFWGLSSFPCYKEAAANLTENLSSGISWGWHLPYPPLGLVYLPQGWENCSGVHTPWKQRQKPDMTGRGSVT